MTLCFGRYETIAPIASGGMATVYLGKAVGAGGFERRVAIKVMHPHIADDPEFEAMFLDEARLAARIHHPNVVATLDIQKTDEAMFLVMEYVEGCSLREILKPLRKAKGRMAIGNALRILVDALAGLHAAHELTGKDGSPLDLVHRDVSPHNILVGADGITKITDFGVARASARLTSTRGGQLKGKIAYMPPEQGRGDEIDRRADVYAAGVVLWETLVGRRLFRAEHDGALVAMVLAGATIAPRELVPFIPEEIDAVCMKALACTPAERYPSAAAFADALEEAAREAQVRIPSARQLAGFVHQYKVEIKSVPPPPDDDQEAPAAKATKTAKAAEAAEATPSHTGGTNKAWPSAGASDEGTPGSTRQSADPINSDPRTTGTSQLSGIGAVHSQHLHTPLKRQSTLLIAAAAAAAVVLIVFIAVLARSGDESPSGASGEGSAAAPPEGVAETSASTTVSPPATETPSPTAEPSAVETSSVTESGPPTAASAAPSAEPSAAPTSTPGPRTGRTGKGKGKGPLGFEPNDL